MKIERINEDKVRITLSFEELEKRNVTLSDIEKNDTIAKNLFVSIIEESDLDEYIEFENSQLFIEAASDNNDTFILTITKIKDLPDLNKYSKKQTKKLYRIDSKIYEFDSLDTILEFLKIAKEQNLYFGSNSLYKYEDKYFVLFSESAIKNKNFLKTYVIMSEFMNRHFSSDLYCTTIREKGTIVIKNRALQKLSKI